MRQIRQPGPPVPERIQWVEARGRAFSFTLEAGLPLLEAARRGFAAEEFASGTLNIKGGALGPFAYVMPALSRTGENAAFYSDTFRPAGITELTMGAMTFGTRDGAPFFHCHALWREADGRAGGGHILPEETIVAEPFAVDAFGLDGAMFTGEPDPETNFKLFGPVPSSVTAATTTSRAYALRLRPNQDFAGALEAFCRERGIISAKLHGGVGSTIGARFVDGRTVEPFATELAIRAGTIAAAAGGALQAELDVALVDYTGGLAEGRLVRGDNPVLMTMELALEVLGRAAGPSALPPSSRRRSGPITPGLKGEERPLPQCRERESAPYGSRPSPGRRVESSTFQTAKKFPRRDAPEFCILFSAQRERAQGMPDARCTRGLVCKLCVKGAHEHTGSAEAIRHSLRNGFTAYIALSPATNSSCHRRWRINGMPAPGWAGLPSPT